MWKDCNVEEWRNVGGFEGLYQVSNLGRVKSLGNDATRKERILKPLIQNKGYFRVALWKGNKPSFKSLHRLVAEHFLDNPENKPQVNHLDGDKANNHVNNLVWCTYRENVNHAVENGLSSYGERNGRAKLTRIQVTEIRESNLSSKDLADRYDVSKSTINRIKRNEGWKIQKTN